MKRLSNEHILSLKNVCEGNLIALHRLLGSFDHKDYRQELHQAFITSIDKGYLHAFYQLMDSPIVRGDAHRCNNLALLKAIERRSVYFIKALLSIEKVRSLASTLDESTREKLKQCLQFEYSRPSMEDDHFMHDATRGEALDNSSTLLQFSKKMAPSKQPARNDYKQEAYPIVQKPF